MTGERASIDEAVTVASSGKKAAAKAKNHVTATADFPAAADKQKAAASTNLQRQLEKK